MSTLNAQILNILRVIAEGETNEEDRNLLPTDLFDNPESFNEFVTDMLQGSGTNEEICDMIRYCIIIDTNIRYRFNAELVDTLEDGEGIPPSAFAKIYNQIDLSFNVSEGQAVASALDGASSFITCGLTGVIRRNYKELYQDNSAVFFYNLIALHSDLSRYNPSSTECWWLDTLFEMYSNDDSIESMEDTFFTDEEPLSEAIELWFIKFVRPLHLFWENAAQVVDEYNPNHLISFLYEDLIKDLDSLYNAGIAKVDAGFVSPISSISLTKQVTNIEQMLFELLTSN